MATPVFKLRIRETVSEAWHKVKGSKVTIWQVLFCMFLLVCVETGIQYVMKQKLVVETSILLILLVILMASIIIRAIFNWGFIYLGIKRAQGNSITFSMIGNVFSFGLVFRMILYTLLLSLIILPVILLFLLPVSFPPNSEPEVELSLLAQVCLGAYYTIATLVALFIFIRLCLSVGLVIEKKMYPWTAMALSFKATRSNVIRLVGLSIVNILIVLLGVITLGIGFIWIIPYLTIVYGVVYNKLLDRSDL